MMVIRLRIRRRGVAVTSMIQMMNKSLGELDV